MPSFIVKAQPDTDWYCLWSSIVDNCTAHGERSELTRRMNNYGEDTTEVRWERADETGTSALQGDDDWNDKAFIVNNVDGYDFPESEFHIGLLLPRTALRKWVETQDHSLLLQEIYDKKIADGVWAPSDPVMKRSDV
jgi:hypothetical protein